MIRSITHLSRISRGLGSIPARLSSRNSATATQATTQADHDVDQNYPHIPIWLEDNLKLKIDERPNETYVETIMTEENPAQIQAKPCVLCRLNLRGLDYTDVMILSRFIKKNGEIMTYHESNLCSREYNRIIRLIEQAQRCNLIERPADYFVPGVWHDLNTYIERDRRRDQPMELIKKQYWRI